MTNFGGIKFGGENVGGEKLWWVLKIDWFVRTKVCTSRVVGRGRTSLFCFEGSLLLAHLLHDVLCGRRCGGVMCQVVVE